MEAACCQILPMGLTTLLGQGRRKKEKELTFIKQSENFQNQKVVSLFLGTTSQGLTTHWRISFAMIQPLEKILEFYVNPTGKTDAIAAQHDVDYSVCGNDRKCKNKADRKMVKSLDAIPWNERQWGHALARNVIDVKQKLGLGSGKKRKKILSEGWAQNLANELHQPIRRQFPKRRVISYGIDNIWAADLVEMGKFSKWNKGIKYLLMVIDVFSKFGWIRPLKRQARANCCRCFPIHICGASEASPGEKTKDALDR